MAPVIPFHARCFLSKGALVSVAQLGCDTRGNGDKGAVLVLEVLPEQSLSAEAGTEEPATQPSKSQRGSSFSQKKNPPSAAECVMGY